MITLDTSAVDLDIVLRRLAALEGQADEAVRPALTRAIRAMTRVAKGLTHVRTGRLRASLHPEGPFDVGSGTLEAIVTPDPVPYAICEVRRGGDHDYAGQAIAEAADILARLEAYVEEAVVAYVRGG